MNPFKTLLNLLLVLILLTGISRPSYAQEETSKTNQPNEVQSLNKIRVNFIGLSYEREQKIGKTTTFYLGAGAEGSLITKSEFQLQEISQQNGVQIYQTKTINKSEFKIFPAVNLGLRQYYNFAKRIQKGRSTANNAAGYFGLDVTGYFPTQKNEADYQINIGPQWGFQSNIAKKVNFELSLGPGVAITSELTEFQLMGKVGFSFLL